MTPVLSPHSWKPPCCVPAQTPRNLITLMAAKLDLEFLSLFYFCSLLVSILYCLLFTLITPLFGSCKKNEPNILFFLLHSEFSCSLYGGVSAEVQVQKISEAKRNCWKWSRETISRNSWYDISWVYLLNLSSRVVLGVCIIQTIEKQQEEKLPLARSQFISLQIWSLFNNIHV